MTTGPPGYLVHRLAESIWNRFLGPLNVYKFGLSLPVSADERGGGAGRKRREGKQRLRQLDEISMDHGN